MKIAIIGGGFTGLTAGYKLLKAGHDITIFERDTILGGLAHGYKNQGWSWSLEKAYHHLFTNDSAIINLIDELGLRDKLIVKRPITANFRNGRMYQFDSPGHLLAFPLLSPLDKLRTGALVAFLKLNPFWQPLERITAQQLFISIGGKAAWNMIWEPLMTGKFSGYAPTVSAAWLWARIKKRTPRLYYVEGGFHTVITALEKAIKRMGGKIYTDAAIDSITNELGIQNTELGIKRKNTHNSQFTIPASPAGRHNSKFDKILLTTPTPIAAKLIQFPISYIKPLLAIPHLHAQTLILETDKPILKDVYWLNVTDRSFPFLAAVAHTNFMDKKHYGGRHLTYFGNYLPQNHPYLSMNKKQLLKVFQPYIQRLNHNSKFIIHNSELFVGPFAQPVHERNYSRRAPKLTTPIPNVYLANMDSIYPWDRGTNYAVELGKKAADKIIRS